jgi:putative two-component system response regulator
MVVLNDTVIHEALRLENRSAKLERRMRQARRELHESHMEAIYMLAVASEAHDPDTGAHVRRVHKYAHLLALSMGLSSDEAECIGYSAILHDVGKTAVPDSLLRKPGALTQAEWQIMQGHTLTGEHMLSSKPFLAVARQIARSHHENWDATGYPDGLSDSRIPLPARIVRIADVFDALTTVRRYKPAWTPERAVAFMTGQARVFDPAGLAAFLQLYRSGQLVGDVTAIKAHPPRPNAA